MDKDDLNKRFAGRKAINRPPIEDCPIMDERAPTDHAGLVVTPENLASVRALVKIWEDPRFAGLHLATAVTTANYLLAHIEALEKQVAGLMEQVRQAAYPCSPLCVGYLREQQTLAERDALALRVEELETALRDMTDNFRPFTSKPIGAPHSQARLEQEAQILAHSAALNALKEVPGC